MTELFDTIKIEAYLNSAWVDLTPDVRQSPSVRVTGIGFSSHAFDDVVGDAGTLTFSLNNSTTSSGGLLGYYSPQSTNCRSGWRAGVPVRLYFEYDGHRRYKFYGYIDNDGIDVETGRYRGRSVHVRASNWLKWASDQSLSLMNRKTNLRIDQAVTSVIENCTRKPLKVIYSMGDLTFPTVFDNMKPDTKALSEIQKLAISELGRVYIQGDDTGGETLVVRNKDYISDYVNAGIEYYRYIGSVPKKTSELTDRLLLEDGTSFLLNEEGGYIKRDSSQTAVFYESDGGSSYNEKDIIDMKLDYASDLFNRAKLTTYPRTVDSSTVVLWTLEEPIELSAGETIQEVRGTYKDPNNEAIEVNGTDMIVPVATTDYLMNAASDGSGANRTSDLVVTASYGSAEVSYSLTNNNAATSYVTFLQARGKGVYIRDKTEKVYDSTSSQSLYGVQTVNIDFPYVSNMTDLFTYASKSQGTMYNGGIFTNRDIPKITAVTTIYCNRSSLSMMAFMFCEPGSQISIFEKVTEYTAANWGDNLYLRGYDFEIVSGKYVKWTLYTRQGANF